MQPVTDFLHCSLWISYTLNKKQKFTVGYDRTFRPLQALPWGIYTGCSSCVFSFSIAKLALFSCFWSKMAYTFHPCLLTLSQDATQHFVSHIFHSRVRNDRGPASVEHVYYTARDLPVNCKDCGKLFSCLRSMKRHVDAVHARKRWLCVWCHKAYTQQDSLHRHQKRDHPEHITNMS